MQRFYRLLANVLFGVHALAGCNAHHAWSHGVASYDQSAVQHADHDCLSDHHDHPHVPSRDSEGPAHPSQHDACSFVKAETVRINHGYSYDAWLTALLPVDQCPCDQLAFADFEPICRADLSSTQLYVWHCALII
jgi:hypothetical protein